jgi:maltose-binding protein MalE
MISLPLRRVALVLAVALAAAPAVLGMARQEIGFKWDHFKGNVSPLTTLIEKKGAKLDPDAVDSHLALVTEDGKIYNLVKDAGSRMFYMDKQLLNRPMRLTARLIPNTQMLQVLTVHSYVNGQLHEVYYWCDICTIRDTEPGDCHCCGGKFEFREVPAK